MHKLNSITAAAAGGCSPGNDGSGLQPRARPRRVRKPPRPAGSHATEQASDEPVTTVERASAYEILETGERRDAGSSPIRVTVHYRGTLTDGKEFDSSYKRGKPATFPVRRGDPGMDGGPAAHEGRRQVEADDPPRPRLRRHAECRARFHSDARRWCSRWSSSRSTEPCASTTWSSPSRAECSTTATREDIRRFYKRSSRLGVRSMSSCSSRTTCCSIRTTRSASFMLLAESDEPIALTRLRPSRRAPRHTRAEVDDILARCKRLS